jgi:hypothetical protein
MAADSEHERWTLRVDGHDIFDELGTEETVKLKSRMIGGHVQDQVFIGPREGALALVGTLMMLPVEWRILHALLRAGMPLRPEGGVVVLFEGEDEVDDAIAKGLPLPDGAL